jgi:Tol biopolymer transport system component
MVNSTFKEENPCISADGLELYFASNRKGGYGGHDIWVTRRQTKHGFWGIPTNLGPTINTDMMDISPCIAADGLSLYLACYQRDREGCYDLFVTERATIEDPWGEPVRLEPDVNFEYNDVVPSISPNGLTLFYARGSVPSLAGLCMTTRATVLDLWEPAIGISSMYDCSNYDYAPSVSADGSTLFFESCRAGSFGESDIWQMSIEPVVDFNGDGIVSALDIAIMIAHWGEDYSLCDIGPTPLGDRIVDVHDLIVLTDHLCLEIP